MLLLIDSFRFQQRDRGRARARARGELQTECIIHILPYIGK